MNLAEPVLDIRKATRGRLRNTQMSDRRQLISASPHAALVAIVGSLAGAAEAQVPPPYPQSQPVQPQQMQMQQPGPLRQVFANTLASVMQGVGTAASAGIVQG